MSTQPTPAQPDATALSLNPLHKMIGAGLLLMVLLWGAMGSGDVSVFIDINMAIWVVGIITAGLWMCFGPGATLTAFRDAVFCGRASHTRQARTIAVLGRAYQLAWAAGLSGFLIGLIIMLSNMNDPAAIGPGMAYSLLTTIYGLILAEFIFSPLQQIQNTRPNSPTPTESGQAVSHGSMLPIGICIVLIAYSSFFVLIVSLWPT